MNKYYIKMIFMVNIIYNINYTNIIKILIY